MKGIIHKNDPKNHNLNALAPVGDNLGLLWKRFTFLSLQGGVEGITKGKMNRAENAWLR